MPLCRLPFLCLLGSLLAAAAGPAGAADDPLPSWNEGATKRAIIEFVERVTTEGDEAFVPVPDRVAVFDNDGTLWAEKPVYVELFFAFHRIRELAPQHPEWKTTEPYASVLKGDYTGALAVDPEGIFTIAAALNAGMTLEAFDRMVEDWFETAENPVKHRLFLDMDYLPMTELLAYLREKEFKTFIVSGGGTDFMRNFTDRLYGVPPSQVVGTSAKLSFRIVDGEPELVILPDVEWVDNGPGKAVGIATEIGQRPVVAFGNSDGDIEMLQYTCLPPGPSFCAFIHHTDGKREWAYDRDSLVGQLDKGLTLAAEHGWTLVDMAKDWETIFPLEETAE